MLKLLRESKQYNDVSFKSRNQLYLQNTGFEALTIKVRNLLYKTLVKNKAYSPS